MKQKKSDKVHDDMNTVLMFKEALKFSKSRGVNIFTVMAAICDAAKYDKKGKKELEETFQAHLKYHAEKRNSTPEKDADDFKKISSFTANMERDITEHQGIYAT